MAMWFFLLLSYLPWWLLYRVSSGLSWFAESFLRYRRPVIIRNLESSFPDMSESQKVSVIKDFYLGLSDLIIESIKTLTINSLTLTQRISISNPELCEEAVQKYGGAIVLAGHQANWEWTLIGGAHSLKVPVIGIYKPLHNHFFDRLMKRIRSKTGAQLVPSDDVFKYVASNQYKPSAIALVADQTPQPKGAIRVEFLNQNTLFFRGPELLYRKTGWPVLFIENQRIARGRYLISFHSIIQPGEPSQEIIPKYALLLEQSIAKNPAQWLWSHRRWKHAIE